MVYTTEEGFIPIPRSFTPDWKVEIIRGNTTDDVTPYILYGKYNLMATEGIGDFEILLLDDSEQTLGGRYFGNETVNFYIDNDIVATTKRFVGKIEKVQKVYDDGGYQVKLTGRHISKELLSINVSKSYLNIDGWTASSILIDLVGQYLTPQGYTTTNVVDTTTTISISIIDKPLWDCIKDLCELANYDCYVDDDKDLHFFERNSILCQTQAIYPAEILTNDGLGDTTFDVKNRVRVYGSSGIVYTSDDVDSQSTYGIVEADPISDSAIITYEEAKKRGDGQLLLYKNQKLQGNVSVLGYPDVNAGEKIWISIPDQSIHNKYRILQITQEFGNDVDVGFKSTFLIEKPIKDLSFVLRDAQRSTSGKDLSRAENPNQMKYSLYLSFNDTTNIETMSGVKLNNGKLILTSGSTTGIMESVTENTAKDVTEVELRTEGSGVDECVYEASADDGGSWQTVTRNTLTPINNPSSNLKLRITMNVTGSTRPEFDWVSLLWTDV